MGWYVIVGTIPIGIVGLLAKDLITGPLRSLWVVAVALILWSGVMLYAERVGKQDRGEKQLTHARRDQSSAWCSASRWCPASRAPARRSRPACCGDSTGWRPPGSASSSRSRRCSRPGVYELKDTLGGSIAVGPVVVGTVVSFVVAYASVAWLLKFVAHHSIGKFVPYRVGLGVVIIVLLATSVMTPT